MFLGTVYLTFGALIALTAGLSQLACYYVTCGWHGDACHLASSAWPRAL